MKDNKVNLIRIGVLAVGVALIVIGACNGGSTLIWDNATSVCTACIGIG